MARLLYTKKFATYGTGPHHCAVAIKNPSGTWKLTMEEGDYAAVKDLYKSMGRSDQTVKVFKLD